MKKSLISVGAILFSFMILGQVWAQKQYILVKPNIAMTPIFMLNHIGDQDWVKGYQLEGDIYLKGGPKIGRFTGEVLFVNPPMNADDSYEHAFMTTLNVIPGYGSFTVTANGLLMVKTVDIPFNIDLIIAWSGSISNGTGFFDNSVGLSAGNSITERFDGGVGVHSSVVITEVLNIRWLD